MSEYDSIMYRNGSNSVMGSNSRLDDDDENRIQKEYIIDYEMMSKELNDYNNMESMFSTFNFKHIYVIML